jgi:hypothetical protein
MAFWRKEPTTEERIRDWLREHPQDAVIVGIDWLILDGADWEPFHWEELPDFVPDAEAFLAGEGRSLNRGDAWLVVKDNRISTMSDAELTRRMTGLWRSQRYCDAIASGRLSVPPGMADYIGLPTVRRRRRWRWPSTRTPTRRRPGGPPWTTWRPPAPR